MSEVFGRRGVEASAAGVTTLHRGPILSARTAGIAPPGVQKVRKGASTASSEPTQDIQGHIAEYLFHIFLS